MVIVHIRFAFAPVLENPGHAAAQQPYFYVGVRNVTRSNALLYESLNFSNEPGVPWKTRLSTPATVHGLADWRHRARQLRARGRGCRRDRGHRRRLFPGGHFGYIYVDAFGRDLPGLSVQKVADKTLVAPGDTLTYTFTYRNGGTASVDNVVVAETVPTQTTFASVSDTTNCSRGGRRRDLQLRHDGRRGVRHFPGRRDRERRGHGVHQQRQLHDRGHRHRPDARAAGLGASDGAIDRHRDHQDRRHPR